MMTMVRLVLAAAFWAASAAAATVNSTWTGNSSNEWGTPNNWNPLGVPHNNGTDIYHASLPPGHAVQLNGDFTIQSLSLAATSSLTIQLTRVLTLHETSVIDGVLHLGTAGNFNAARLRIGADLSLTGTGTLELRGVPVIDSPPGARLTIGAGVTLHALNTSGGFGDYPAGLRLTNNGELDFEGAGDNNFSHPDGTLLNAGTWKVRSGSVVNISAANNLVAFENSGLVEIDNARMDLEFTSFVNTSTLRVRNGGVFEFADGFNNTGGTIELESGGKLVSANFFNGQLSGGAITGVGGIVEPQGTLTLQGGTGNDAMDITGTAIVTTPGNFVVLQGEFDLAGGAQFTGPGIRVNGNVDIDGAGTLPLQLHGQGGNDTLSLEQGITLTTGPGAGPVTLSVQTVNTAGPVEIDSTEFMLANGCTLNSSGPVHLFPNAQFICTSATFAQNGSTLQLDAGARITGGISLQNTTTSGGVLRPHTLTLAGTNQISSAIETSGNTMIVASGAAVLNGTSTIAVNAVSNGTTTVKAAASGGSLTTGSGIDLTMSQGTLRNELDQWRFAGTANFSSSIFVLAADFENDGAINLVSGAQAQVNKSIVAGSTGTLTAAGGTTVVVNGASILGGTIGGAGNFTFSGAIPVTVSDFAGTGAITLNTGAKVNFSSLVSAVSTLTVNSNNAHVSFNGGLTSVAAATISGSGGVFEVMGNTTTTGLVRIQSNATHRGAGTTTTQGPVEYTGKLDGRTVIAQGATTVFQLTLQNNAVFENQNTLTLFNFGTPNTVTGTGTFRNTGTLNQSDLFGPSPNTISVPFEQTSTGTMVASAELTLNGNSTIAGSVSIPADGKLILGAGASNTTHAVTGQLTGTGVFEVSENTLTGTDATVLVTGAFDLSGASSTTVIRGGSLILNTAALRLGAGAATAPRLGAEVQIDGGRFKIAGGAAPLPVDRVFFSGPSVLEGPDAGPRIPFTAILLNAQGSDIDACSIRNMDLLVEQTCSVQGLVDLKDSTLETGPGCTATLYDGTHLTSTTGDGACVNNGGTWVIPEFEQVELSETLPFQDYNGAKDVRAHGELSLNGSVVSSTSNVTVAANATLNYNGPLVAINSTFTAAAGSGGDSGGTIRMNNVKEMTDCTVTADANANVSITLPTDNEDRNRVKTLKVFTRSTSLEDALNVQWINIFFPNSVTEVGAEGCVNIADLANKSIDIEAGSSAGRLKLVGDLPLGPRSKIIAELGGTAQTTQYDLLSITGVLTATNTSLRPRFISNFQNSITPAHTFTVIETTQPIVGSFYNVFNGRVMAADGTGTFSVTMANGNTHVVLGDFIPGDVIDSDNDGMSDEFEQQYFGSPTGGDPALDHDGDGMSNVAEYRAGTDPTNSQSLLQITETRREGNNFVIAFIAAPDKSYRVEAGASLTSGYPLTIQNVPATPEGGPREVIDVGGATQPARFYRVVVQP